MAELEADSSGKFWAEVDKDIRAVAYTLTKAGVFYDSKYSVLLNIKSKRGGRMQRH